MLNKQKNGNIIPSPQSEEDKELEQERRLKKAKRRRINTLLDRIFGFFLVTAIVIGCTGLAVEYIIIDGPSPSLKNIFTMTMLETRRFGFIPNIFLSQAEIDEIREANNTTVGADEMDSSLISIPAVDEVVDKNGVDSYGLQDEDGDGIIILDIKGSTYVGYMLVVLDPTRVFLGEANFSSGIGYTLEQMVDVYDALGGINAGGFQDDTGAGLGGVPGGLTFVNGFRYNYNSYSFCGFDADGLMHVGSLDSVQAVEMGIVDGVTFGPVLVVNGEPANPDSFESGVNPRTAIGQRADGAVLMLVIDGRQLHSVGASYQDLVDIMIDYGAVNACNMDGGSSTCMYYGGQYVNSYSAATGARPLPTAWLVK